MITKSFQKFFLYILIFSLFAFLIPTPAEAEDIIKVKFADTTAEIWAQGRLLGRIPQGNASAPSAEEVEKWAANLEKVFKSSPPPKSIHAEKGAVFCWKTSIMQFSKETAALLKITPQKAAEKWAANIRFALKNAPSFDIKKTQVTIPLNEDSYISYTGNYSGEIDFLDFSPNLVQPKINKDKKLIIIRGVNLGKGSISIKAGNIEKTVYFKVLERAGKLPDYLNLAVTGSPASASSIKNALESVINYRSSAKSGAYVVIDKPTGNRQFSNIPQGGSSNLIIPVKVDGPEFIPEIKKISVKIENACFNRREPSRLFVSNKPELIKREGELMSAVLPPDTPTQYFYHHKNAGDEPWRNFYVTLENQGNSTAKVFISPNGAGPTKDEIFAGHLAASEFFTSRRTGSGWFITVNPGTRFTIENLIAKSNQTISGVGFLQITEGPSLKFTCIASNIPGKKPPADAEPTVEKPDARTSKGVFHALIKSGYHHEIGGKFTYIYLGGEPYQADIYNGQPNYGNYGNIYDLDITVKNGRECEKDAWVYFIPSGGPARGIFEVDGKVIETPVSYVSQKVLLKKVTLSPGENRKVRIITMPQGGSYYPIRIAIESEFVKDQASLK